MLFVRFYFVGPHLVLVSPKVGSLCVLFVWVVPFVDCLFVTIGSVLCDLFCLCRHTCVLLIYCCFLFCSFTRCVLVLMCKVLFLY